MRKYLSLFVTAAVILSFAAVGCPAYADLRDEIDPVTLMVYTPDDAESPSCQTLKEYASLISEASEHLITLDIHHSGELGDANAAIAATQSGVIDIALVSTDSLIPYYERARMLSLPFLFDDSQQACEAANGEAGELIFSALPDIGLTFLAQCDGPARHLAATRPVSTAKNVEGLTVTFPDQAVCWDVWNTLTAVPTLVSAADVPAAIAAGTLQAMDGSARELVENDNYKGITDLALLHYIWTGTTLLMNAATYNELPLEAQAILTEQAANVVPTSIDAVAEEENAALEELEADGITVDREPKLQTFRKALGGDAYYDHFGQSYWWYIPEAMAAMLKEIR